MKKLLILFALLGLLAGCTDSPTAPDGDTGGGDSYTITLTPESATAYVSSGTTLRANEVVVLTGTVKKGGAIVTEPLQVIFSASGSALFVETGTATYTTLTENGSAKVTVFSQNVCSCKVDVWVKKDTKAAKDSSTVSFILNTVLTVTGVTPNTGTILGGETVTITGTGFEYPLEANFGTERAIYVSHTYNSLVVQTPSHYPSHCNANDVVDVKVTIYPGESAQQTDLLSDGYTYLAEPLTPTITGVSPNHGDTDGGTLVTIYGTNFYCGEGVLVYFKNGTLEAPGRVRECSPTQILVESPAARDIGVENCDATVGIKVLNICGGLNVTFPDAFKYGPTMQITAWGPAQGPATGGTYMTIYGQGFDAPVAVTLAGVGARVVGVSNSEITVESGGYDPQGKCENAQGSIMVTDIDCGMSAETAEDAWTYIVPKLFVSSVYNFILPGPPYPDNSGLAGDTAVINGTGLIPPLEVLFGNTQGVVTTISADYTTIQVTVPPFTGTWDTEPCTIGGCTGERDMLTPVDVKVTSLYTGCSYTFKSFFYIPAITACQLPAPTCTMTASSAGCTVTYSVAAVCGATYVWNQRPGGCADSGNTIYSCAMPSGTSGPVNANVQITTSFTIGCPGTLTLPVGQCP